MKLLIATGNAHKLEEFRRILAPLGVEAVSPAELGAALEVEETGKTFMENARIKAKSLRDLHGLGVVADDSGLCVDALDGRPGVYSARYMGKDTPHSKKISGILNELEGVPEEKRGARFICAICCVLEDGTVLECEGVCEGSIAHVPHGTGGFGYDPIFLVGGRSFADLAPEEKDRVSHRGIALRLLAEKLQTYLITGEIPYDNE